MTRRDFFKFIVIGGIVGFLSRKLKTRAKPKKARFWRKAN